MLPADSCSRCSCRACARCRWRRLTVRLRLLQLVVAGSDERQVGLSQAVHGTGIAASLLAAKQARRVLGERPLDLSVTGPAGRPSVAAGTNRGEGTGDTGLGTGDRGKRTGEKGHGYTYQSQDVR